MSELLPLKPIQYAVVKGYRGEGHFGPLDLNLIKIVVGAESWKGTDFEDNKFNLRASFESRIVHADMVKRPIVLRALGFEEGEEKITDIPKELSPGISEIIPEIEDPELGRLIKLRNGAFAFGPIEKGSTRGMGKEIGRPLFQELDTQDEVVITETIGAAHCHPHVRFSWKEESRRLKLDESGFSFPPGAPEYSSVPSLGDLINSIIHPEVILSMILAGDRSFTLVLRPKMFLDHFRNYWLIPQEEWDRLITRRAEAASNLNEGEAWSLAKDFASRTGLKMFRGELTADNQFVLKNDE